MKQIKKVSRTSLETSAYELPIASDTTLGGIKIGASLDIDTDGILNISGDIKDIVYSDDANETIVGYIIENNVKIPLYRKIFKGEKVAGSNLVFDTTALDIDKVLNILGTTDRGTWVYPLMRYEASDNLTFAYYMPNDNKLVFTSGTSSWSSTGKVTIILEYTKKNIDESSVNINRVLCEKSVYSTEETVVGTWIDGKPLYRKVLSSTTISDSNVDITLPSNIDFMSTDKVEINVGGFSFFSDRYTNERDLIQIFKLNATTLRVVLGEVWKSGFKSAIIAIEYTKTTD